jgi:two-component system OmpR family response regulator
MNGTSKHGEIGSETLPALLLALHTASETGPLTLQRGAVTKILKLSQGAVVFAATNNRDDGLLQLLLKRGAVTLPDLMRALEISLKEKIRLGEALLSQKLIQGEELQRALTDQLKDIVCKAFEWTSGTWKFESGDAASEVVTLQTHPLALILEAIRRIDSWTRVYSVVGGMNAEYLATRQAAELVERAELLPGERQILNLCEESRSLADLCRAVQLNDFVVCKVVWGLLALGALMKV